MAEYIQIVNVKMSKGAKGMLLAEFEAMKLKPIAEAPKDGRMILGYYKNMLAYESPIVIRWSKILNNFELGKDRVTEEKWAWNGTYHGYHEYSDNFFTHFIEIPQSVEKELRDE